MKTLNQCLAAGAVLTFTALAAPTVAQEQRPFPQQTEPQTSPRPQDPTPPWSRPQERPPVDDNMPTMRTEARKVSGTLVKVDNDQMQLRIKGADDTEHTFRYTAATKVEGADAQVSGLATREGQMVTVHYTEGSGDTRIATKVEFGKSKK